jgi:hypothetical protein
MRHSPSRRDGGDLNRRRPRAVSRTDPRSGC